MDWLKIICYIIIGITLLGGVSLILYGIRLRYKNKKKEDESKLRIHQLELELKKEFKKGYDRGQEDAIKSFPNSPYSKIITHEMSVKKPELVKVVLKFPMDMFEKDYDNAIEYVKKEIGIELGRHLVDTDKIYITQSDNPANFEKTFTATCYVTKGYIE